MLRRAGSRIEAEIALTREEILKSREATNKLLSEHDQRMAESREATNKLLADLNQRMAERREETKKLFAEQAQRNADMRQFMREERLRANKVLEPLITSHHELIAEIRAQRVEMRAEMRAQREETRAQREGFFALIDQLKEGGRPGGASS